MIGAVFARTSGSRSPGETSIWQPIRPPLTQTAGSDSTAVSNTVLAEVKGFCAIADLETIKRQDYILTPGRYVGIEEQEKIARILEAFDKKIQLNSNINDNLAA